jgi:hypothetical protein
MINTLYREIHHMAVVQISKIQVRRGQKNSPSGIPQLSSAEFAWAVDSQELFIGNGSVAEGAPFVGNTKILTENDNILELISGYRFASNDISIINSVSRPLQSKLDEYVSVADYGAAGDGISDSIPAFEKAFSELFRNNNSNYRKVLLVPNGNYFFSRDLEIPSNAIIQGETQENTRLIFGSNNIRLITDKGTGFSGFSSTDRPQNIKIYNLTISRTTGQTDLSGLRNSIFENVSFIGNYEITSDTIGSIETDPSAVFWNNISPIKGIVVTDINFKNCLFQSNSVSVKCLQRVSENTEVNFDNCKFFIGNTSIFIDGIAGQLTSWKIKDCEFEEIARQAFRSTYGRNTLVKDCQFKNCGNGENEADSPLTNIISFGESTSNQVLDCVFDRAQAATIDKPTDTPVVAEVLNANAVRITNRVFANIFKSDTFIPLTRLSVENKFTIINYFLRLGDHNRIGQLHLTVDENLSTVSITDSYQYSGLTAGSVGGITMTNFQFGAELLDNDTDSGIDTVLVTYRNDELAGREGKITFDVSYGNTARTILPFQTV